MKPHPLVSCIMPTCNRRAFVPRAISYFLRQDYPDRELIIVDDGTDAAADLVPDVPRIRYLRLERKETIGAKRNLACEQARGEIILHWDDDDWMAAWRISYQVEQLLADGADICGLDTLLFYAPASRRIWQYRYPPGNRSWLAGGTFCYLKSFWKQNPFLNINTGEDTRFVWRGPARKIVALSDQTFYVALIHEQNTSPKNCRGSRWTVWGGDLQQIMGPDLTHYHPPGDPPKTVAAEKKPRRKAPMKLNLGCCDAILPGYVNVDRVPGPGVEAADLGQAWPWPDSSVEYVRAWDIIEHLPDKIFTMNELWRVLQPGGQAEIVVPTTDGTGAWQDPTHVSFWNRRSFLYYEAGNPYRERFAGHYGIKAKFRVVRDQTKPSMDGPRLTILLEAVKP